MRETRPLVGGYLERISAKAFEEYHREITDLVVSQHGVYALYKDTRLYYVGLAGDLRRRVKQHLKDKHRGQWNRFSLYLVRKVGHIKEIESLLLRIAHPTGNKQGGRLRKATNLQKQLRKLMEQRQRRQLDEIFSRKERASRKKKRSKVTAGRTRKSSKRPLEGIVGGKRIYATYKGKKYKAIVYRNGRIKLNGKLYDSPSGAGRGVRGRATDGWSFWRVRHKGELVKLKELRK